MYSRFCWWLLCKIDFTNWPAFVLNHVWHHGVTKLEGK